MKGREVDGLRRDGMEAQGLTVVTAEAQGLRGEADKAERNERK